MNACKMNRSLCCITSTVRKEHGHAPVRPWALWGRWQPLLCSVQERSKGHTVGQWKKKIAACIAGQIRSTWPIALNMNRFLNISQDPSIKMKDTKERCPQILTNNQSIFHKGKMDKIMLCSHRMEHLIDWHFHMRFLHLLCRTLPASAQLCLLNLFDEVINWGQKEQHKVKFKLRLGGKRVEEEEGIERDRGTGSTCALFDSQ